MYGVENPADLFGVEPIELVVALEDRDRALRRMRILLDKREPVPLAEMRLQRRDGRPSPWQLRPQVRGPSEK